MTCSVPLLLLLERNFISAAAAAAAVVSHLVDDDADEEEEKKAWSMYNRCSELLRARVLSPDAAHPFRSF